MSKREGPKLKLSASCFDCAHERSAHYAVQGDSGHDVSCAHPDNPGKSIGDTRWETPNWCPLLRRAKVEYIKAELADPLVLGAVGVSIMVSK